jgi:hypothetical protein
VTAGVSGDLNQAALMAIVDGFHYWLLVTGGDAGAPVKEATKQPVGGLAD